jgi:hypothetical protein
MMRIKFVGDRGVMMCIIKIMVFLAIMVVVRAITFTSDCGVFLLVMLSGEPRDVLPEPVLGSNKFHLENFTCSLVCFLLERLFLGKPDLKSFPDLDQVLNRGGCKHLDHAYNSLIVSKNRSLFVSECSLCTSESSFRAFIEQIKEILPENSNVRCNLLFGNFGKAFVTTILSFLFVNNILLLRELEEEVLQPFDLLP